MRTNVGGQSIQSSEKINTQAKYIYPKNLLDHSNKVVVLCFFPPLKRDEIYPDKDFNPGGMSQSRVNNHKTNNRLIHLGRWLHFS